MINIHNSKNIASKFNKKLTLINDLTRFQNIHKKPTNYFPIYMNIFDKNNFDNNTIDILKHKINKIVHIYQEKYAFNSHPTGLGDFIRSCFFIIQFCVTHKLKYDIIINHPISYFFKNCNKCVYNSAFTDKITIFSENNWEETIFNDAHYIQKYVLINKKRDEFISYLCNLPIFNKMVFSYNILFPYDGISMQEIQLVRHIFEPSNEINDMVDNKLSIMGLIKKKYITYHIRCGDMYLINGNKLFSLLYYTIVKNELATIIDNNADFDVLLISDNNEIKILLHKELQFKYLIHTVTHIGEGVTLVKENLQNTMIDFYLMANSHAIYSLSTYIHGSGFSYWCAKMYDIPYKGKYIKL